MAARVRAAGALKRPATLSPETTERLVALVRRLLAANTKRVVIATRVGLSEGALGKLIRAHGLAPAPARAVPIEVPAEPPAIPVAAEPEPQLEPLSLPLAPAVLAPFVAAPLDPEAAHLVCFALPPLPVPLPVPPESVQAWALCRAKADHLEMLARDHRGAVRSGLLHLADLRRNHLTFYPGKQASSGALPMHIPVASPLGLGGGCGATWDGI